MSNTVKRLIFTGIFLGIVTAEIALALFPTGLALQPYLAVALASLALYALLRVIIPKALMLLPLYVFIAALAFEALQTLGVLPLMGIRDGALTGKVAGLPVSWANILCYAAACVLLVVYELIKAKKEKK